MNTIVQHIEYLLTKHDCVVIPGFGGFVLHHQEAVFLDNHHIQPPCKIASFNPSLNHNDGLLANSLMAEKKIIFSEAMILIEAEVQLIKETLSSGSVVDFGSIGSFVQDNDTVQFTPQRYNSFDLDMFGFAPFSLIPLHIEEQLNSINGKSSKDPDVIFVPVNLRFLRHVSAVAVMIIAFLMIAQPLEHGTISSNYASMISSDLLSKSIVPDMNLSGELLDEDPADHSIEFIPEPVVEVAPVVVVEAPVAKTPVESAPSAQSQPAAVQPVAKPQPVLAKAAVSNANPAPVASSSSVSSSSKRYYVIVASCPSDAHAIDFMSRIDKSELPSCGMLDKEGKYRVYLSSFDDKNEANSFLNKLMAESKQFTQAWILPLKQ